MRTRWNTRFFSAACIFLLSSSMFLSVFRSVILFMQRPSPKHSLLSPCLHSDRANFSPARSHFAAPPSPASGCSGWEAFSMSSISYIFVTSMP